MSAFTCKYCYKEGFHIDKRFSAQVVGEMCEELSNTIGLTPKTLLDANRDMDTPLHDYFEWDNDVAAEKYREEQARYIIRSLVVIPQDTEPEVRAFQSIILENDDNVFEHVNTIVKREDLTAQMLEKAKKELYAFQTKYNSLRTYTELSEVFTSIDNLRKEEKNYGEI